MHDVADTHDTPLRPSWLPSLGLGTIDQAVPFHDSMSVLVLFLVLLGPTAVHDVADTHDTPLRLGNVV